MSEVQGHCDPAFKAVREVFEDNLARGREVGAAVAVHAAGRPVVDLWGGLADHRTGRPWRHDTPCPVVSCAKAVTATAALLLLDRGAYELDESVVTWWPEYGAHGKEATTPAQLLSHQAGLPALGRRVPVDEAADHGAMAAELARQVPEWEPGTAHGYHVVTFGWLAGEIVRRHAGSSVGTFIRREFARDLDLWIGAPPDVLARAARMTTEDEAGMTPGDAAGRSAAGRSAAYDPAVLAGLAVSLADPGSTLNRALYNVSPREAEGFNDPVMLAGGWPAMSMVTTAPALAAFYRDLVAGLILRPATLREATTRLVRGPDRVIVVDSAYGLGFQPAESTFGRPLPAAASAFGHSGAGGSIGLGDLEAELALAYVPNLMGHHFAGDRRAYHLVEAVYAALA
ncbi:serine hydrolase domain-containing protein [Actinomadura fulvescens]|uniref:Serine hydrolase domain-containing protein n=1 Tax=Actinomadura fulvescens TaxID=46160 RepID=A0ABN3PFP1_9ACTN